MAAFSRVTSAGTGAAFNASFSFPYLNKSDIYVFVDGISVPFTFLNTSTVTPTANPAAGATVQVRRSTQKTSSPVDFTDGSVLLERDLDLLSTYSLYLAQEADDAVTSSITLNTSNLFDAQGVRIINVAQPVALTDAVNRQYFESVYTPQLDAKVTISTQQAAASSASAAAALASKNAAGASEAVALASKNASAASEASALASKNASATSEANALASKNSAETANTSSIAAKNASETARDVTIAARDIAVTSKDTAVNKASEASGFAATSITQAGIATTKADFAGTKANEAASSASTAVNAAAQATVSANTITSNTLIPQQGYTVAEATADFTLPYPVGTANALLVTLNGVPQAPDAAYSCPTTTTLRFSETIPVGSVVLIRYLDKEAQAGAAAAQEWAVKTGGVVTGTTEYSSKKYAVDSASSASAAAGSSISAANSASAGATSATNSANSATSSANSATASAESASGASTAKTAAETARDAAVTAKTAADTSQGAAASSAASAAGSATTATTKASESSANATSAAGLASTATTKASEASTSAANAATSATNSENSATASASSATASAGSSTLASEWATRTSGAVSGTEYSAKYHAQQAAASAVAAASVAGQKPASQYFTGTGAATVFTLTSAYAADRIEVTVNTVLQEPTYAFTVSGTTLTLTAAPNNGARIFVRYL